MGLPDPRPDMPGRCLSWVIRYRGHQAPPTSHVRFAPKATVAGRKAKCSEVPLSDIARLF